MAMTKEEKKIYQRDFCKKWQKENRESISKKQKIYQEKNREKIKKDKAKYYIENKESKLAYEKLYKQTASGRFCTYKSSAKERNLEFSITLEQFAEFWNKPCGYCGEEIETIGIDRIDNVKGYTLENIISCCETCNRMKLAMTQEQFFKKCVQISNKLNIEAYKNLEAK